MTGGIDWRIDVADTGRINLRLDTLPREIQRRLKQTIGQLTQELLVRVHAAQPVRTGTLRRATRAFVDERPNFVRGRVRVLGGYGNLGARFGALEYGGPGARRRGRPVQVRAYSRSGVRVGGYTRRQPRIRAMRFLRGPAAGLRPRVIAALEAALQKL